MVTSLFSKWPAEMVVIHDDTGYKVKAVSMSASQDDSVSGPLKSCPSMNGHMHLTSYPIRPWSRLNVSKTKGVCPVTDDSMMTEKRQELLRRHEELVRYVSGRGADGVELEMGVAEGANDEHHNDNVVLITHKSSKGVDKEGESGDNNNKTLRQTFILSNDDQEQDSGSRHWSDKMTEWERKNPETIEMDTRMKRLLAMLQMNGVVAEEERKDAELCIYEHGEMQKSRIARVGILCGHLEGFPAVVEGDHGVYVKGTVPVAPLLRRDDGICMKQGI
ncbi:hypothetical protein K4K59_005783 [Colletotrichum sp. SAR11_240]|nr:hypothetical protein K4K59_005783 [Colletotrichum sp. SAR11_240]